MKKVLAVTGIRSEYYILYPVIKLLMEDKDFQVKLVVCGAHLSPWHGETVKDIVKDGFEIADMVDSLFSTNRIVQRAKNVGVLIYGLSQTVERENPDFLLVVGDREEAIATAIVGNYMDILVAHIGGGDPVFGNADDPIRMAVSKLAHVHLVTAKEYADNLIKIGEEEFRIFNVGNPIYTAISWVKKIDLKKLSEFLDFDISDGKYGVFIKHPLSSEVEQFCEQFEIALKAISNFAEEYNYKFVGIYPNTDPGSFDIVKIIEKFSDKRYIKFYKTIPRDIFVNLMRNAKVLVGNSSMGFLEAPFYKLPVVNIGHRQRGRLNPGNVEFVEYSIDEIKQALKKAVFDEDYRKMVKKLQNPFGDERNAYKIIEILKAIDPNDKNWHVKRKLC